jgi:hypothetical protein
VLGGYLSPVSSSYNKPGLAGSMERVNLCKAADSTSDWIMTDDWEASQPDHVKTLHVLQSVSRRLCSSLEVQPVRLRLCCTCRESTLSISSSSKPLFGVEPHKIRGLHHDMCSPALLAAPNSVFRCWL